jgi:tRNA-specific 2-thiouridylase
MGQPYFVVSIEPETREVVIGTKEAMMRTGLVAKEANWFIERPTEPLRCQVQIRYNADAVDATVYVNGDDEFTVEFDVAEAGVAPGQAAVIYEGNRVLGGGWIEKSL